MDTTQIKSLGTPKMRRNRIDGLLDIISPVELTSGEWSVYIQGIDHGTYDYSPEGSFKTEDEAVQSGYQYLEQWEAELTSQIAA